MQRMETPVRKYGAEDPSRLLPAGPGRRAVRHAVRRRPDHGAGPAFPTPGPAGTPPCPGAGHDPGGIGQGSLQHPRHQPRPDAPQQAGEVRRIVITPGPLKDRAGSRPVPKAARRPSFPPRSCPGCDGPGERSRTGDLTVQGDSPRREPYGSATLPRPRRSCCAGSGYRHRRPSIPGRSHSPSCCSGSVSG